MEIIGHKEIISYLNKALEQGNLAHAYLFAGPEHVGKTTAARWMIEKLLKIESDETLRQAQGDAARHFWQKPNPDLHLISRLPDKKEITVEQVRQLRVALSQKPLIQSHKAVLIENVESMSVAAINALLKTLEEPAGDTLIILTSAELDRVLKTIVSRCQLVKFKRVPYQEIVDGLRPAKNKSVELAAALSSGRPGYAINWLEDKSVLDEMAGLPNEFINLFSGPIDERLSFIEELMPKGKALNEQSRAAIEKLKNWQLIIRDVLLLRAGESGTITNRQAADKLKKFADSHPYTRLVTWHKDIESAKQYINQNTNPRLVLESLLINIS